MFVGEHRWISEPRDPSYCYIVTSMDPSGLLQLQESASFRMSRSAILEDELRQKSEVPCSWLLVSGNQQQDFSPFFPHIFKGGCSRALFVSVPIQIWDFEI